MNKEFKLIVAGGRDFNDRNQLVDNLIDLAMVTYKDKEISIVTGMARGADLIAHDYAIASGIQVYKFVPDWRPNGVFNKGAGHARNRDMGDFADGLLAFWDGQSKGTKGMIDYMHRLNKPVYVVRY